MSLAVLLYLYDSTLLLYANEAILFCSPSGRWTAASGWEGLGIAGRLIYILNPLTAQRASFRLQWQYRVLETGAAISEGWPEYPRTLRLIAPVGPMVGIGLFVLLPIGLFTPARVYALVPALIAIYGSTLVGLVILSRRRETVAISKGRFVAVSIECLLCPPLAVNMLRRITLAVHVKDTLPTAAARLLAPDDWAFLRERCRRRLDDAIQSLPEGSSDRAALQSQKERLNVLAPS